MYDPNIHHRRSIRLKGYDYSLPGAYFVTLVVQGQEHLLGRVHGEIVGPSRFGEIVLATWDDLPQHYPRVVLDAFCLMPNHVHAIIVLTDEGMVTAGVCRGGSVSVPGQGLSQASLGPQPLADEDKTRPYGGPVSSNHLAAANVSLPDVVCGFKSFTARRINQLRGAPGAPVWQRNYYEHIIRDHDEWTRIQAYILANPINWSDDPENKPL
jgi:REP element-mobilizing transposase RayT